MDDDLESLDPPSHADTVKAFVRKLQNAVEHKDASWFDEFSTPDVFVLGSAADAVFNDRIQFLQGLQGLFAKLQHRDLVLHETETRVGICDSGRNAWFLDRFNVEVSGDSVIPRSIPIRLTGLLVLDPDWHLSAASWSIPLRGNDYQYALLAAGRIPPGVSMQNQVSLTAQPIAGIIHKVMVQPSLMPSLYSTRPDAFTIGSTVDEVFFGSEGRNWVGEIVVLPLQFTVRGGIQAAVSPDGSTAWLAANIDLSGGLTVPYRFFYVWLNEQDGWQIVLSHDAVCIDPFDPGFDYP